MRKFILCIFMFVILFGCSSSEKKSKTPDFDFLNRISLHELDNRIKKGESLYVYLGWTENSAECVKFQENYLEPYIEYYNWNGMLTVCDLDIELPEGLNDKEVRSVLKEKYNVRYAPCILYIHFGEIKNILQWTPETNDLETGIDASIVNEWMKEVKLMR